MSNTIHWRSSSYSGASGSCVEVGTDLTPTIRLRDTKDRAGGVVAVSAPSWSALLAGLR